MGALLLGQSVLFYAKTPEMDSTFNFFHNVGKLVLPLAFFILFLSEQKANKFNFVFILAGIVLYVDSLFAFTQNKYVVEQIIEHALKFGLPIIYGMRKAIEREHLNQFLKMLVAFTFIGHGLFALGIHFIPGGFIQMVQNVLGFNIETSRQFLHVIGALDLIFVILLFIPKLDKVAVFYMIFWGLLTSMARVVGYFGNVPIEEFLKIYCFEMLWRWPHFLIPFYLFLSVYSQNAFFFFRKTNMVMNESN